VGYRERKKKQSGGIDEEDMSGETAKRLEGLSRTEKTLFIGMRGCAKTNASLKKSIGQPSRPLRKRKWRAEKRTRETGVSSPTHDEKKIRRLP